MNWMTCGDFGGDGGGEEMENAFVILVVEYDRANAIVTRRNFLMMILGMWLMMIMYYAVGE